MAHAEEWLTLREAAGQMGCSVVTLRRAIRKGSVQARQVPGKHGPTWQVASSTLSTPLSRLAGRVDHPPTAQGAEGSGLADLVAWARQLEADKSALQAQLAQMEHHYQQQVWHLECELAEAVERLKALAEPKVVELAAGPTSDDGAVSRPAAKRWWRFGR